MLKTHRQAWLLCSVHNIHNATQNCIDKRAPPLKSQAALLACIAHNAYNCFANKREMSINKLRSLHWKWMMRSRVYSMCFVSLYLVLSFARRELAIGGGIFCHTLCACADRSPGILLSDEMNDTDALRHGMCLCRCEREWGEAGMSLLFIEIDAWVRSSVWGTNDGFCFDGDQNGLICVCWVNNKNQEWKWEYNHHLTTRDRL